MQVYISKHTWLRAGVVFRTLAGSCWVGGDETGGDGHAATAATSHMAWMASVSRASLRETSGRRGRNLHISTSRMEMPSHHFAALKCVAMLSRSSPRFLWEVYRSNKRYALCRLSLQVFCPLSAFGGEGPSAFLFVGRCEASLQLVLSLQPGFFLTCGFWRLIDCANKKNGFYLHAECIF